MATRMLIDARHPEETRVAVLKGNRIEEFDFESADRKQIKGNIYLAKVTRVEPSLQAAFVDFGGNRHGFLAFSEIHPDYYQIPKEDRAALLAEEAAHAEEEAALRAAEDDGSDDEYDGDDETGDEAGDETGDALADDLAGDDGVEEIDTSEKDEVSTIEDGQLDNDGGTAADEDSSASDASDDDDQSNDTRGRGRRGRRRQGRGQSKQADELRAKRMALRRRYKIQDVIQRRQVLLVQVVKEERGNKGAALTSYLSLAGRYCVLMPNSSHGGGISRKISSASDRKRLKQIVSELSLPKSMGCIVRTAGLQRTKPEIKRDFDYLARLWDEIRENTLGSSAPALIHSDSDLIKRAIRDIYNREIEEVVVEGDEGYKAARQFMKLLMPSHVRRIKAYADPVPLFQRYGAEDQLSAMYEPVVQLKSGGYLVINPTEALVSIDINSGRSTKEHGIEQTALATNLEAAREIARQLRLRDMAGLVVIDFIDMEHGSNVRKIEKAMKDALKNDRARIQVGRISGFGLMEMSRQRLRTGVLEATTRECPHCDGTGLVRTASSAGLSALRLIEDEAAKGKGNIISLYASSEAAIYLLNAKRSDLAEIEHRYAVTVEVLPEGENEGAKMRVGSSGIRPTSAPKFEAIIDDDEDDDEEFDAEDEAEFETSDDGARNDANDADGDGDGSKKRRRRRRGGRGRKRTDEQLHSDNGGDSGQVDDADGGSEEGADAEDGEERNHDRQGSGETDGDAPRKKRRRRGGRGRRRPAGGDEAGSDQASSDQNADSGTDQEMAAPEPGQSEPGQSEPGLAADQTPVSAGSDYAEAVSSATVSEGDLFEVNADLPAPAEKPRRTRRPRKSPKSETETGSADMGEAGTASDAEASVADDAETKPKPKRTRRKKAEPAAEEPSDDTASPADEAGSSSEAPSVSQADAAPRPKRPRRKKAIEADASASQSGEEAAPDTQTSAEQNVPQSTSVQAAPAIVEAAQAAAPAPVSEPFSAPVSEPVPEPSNDISGNGISGNDTNGETEDDGGPARRGWWQRTFGN